MILFKIPFQENTNRTFPFSHLSPVSSQNAAEDPRCRKKSDGPACTPQNPWTREALAADLHLRVITHPLSRILPFPELLLTVPTPAGDHYSLQPHSWSVTTLLSRFPNTFTWTGPVAPSGGEGQDPETRALPPSLQIFQGRRMW